MDLSGRTVAITGAASGIGAATAVACAAAGASVALAARREDRLAEVAEQVRQAGGKALVVPTDVADESQCKAFIDATTAEFGRIDGLVNNAGVMLLGPVVGAPTEEWRRMVDVNILGLLYCTHAALPIMLEQGSGDIVNLSSVAGRFARAGGGVYCLTKFGVNGFSEALRQEVSTRGVRVTVIEPGLTQTELASHNREEVREQMAGMFKGVKAMSASDIAETIVFAMTRPQHMLLNEVLIRPTSQP